MKNKINKIFTGIALALTLILVGEHGKVSAFVSQDIHDLYNMNSRIKEIDFSKEPNQLEKEILKDYYAKDSELFFNDKVGDAIYLRDKIEIENSINSNGQSREFLKENYKEHTLNNSYANRVRSNNNSRLGTYGDILVTYTFSSFGREFYLFGHAAIVHNNSDYTIESYKGSAEKADGVRIYTNNWASRDRVYGVRVRNASMEDYKNAANYAIRQADLKKPYNINFFNKGTTSKFYCSQLVWRAWKNQGFEIDRMNLGNWEPVSPAELVGARDTYVFYKK